MLGYLDLFFAFIKVGMFTFGGGYAMLPILQREVVTARKWTTESEVLDYYAISQCMPGIVMVNVATFIGYKRKGGLGSVIASLGVVFPSLLIILSIAMLLDRFAEYLVVQQALAGIRACVCALIVTTIYTLVKNGIKDLFSVVILIAAFLVSLLIKMNPVYVVIVAGLLGILRGIITSKRKIQ